MSYNTATLIGRLGRDPDIRYTKDQQPIAALSLATTDVYTDKTSGQRKGRTEWHRVVLFGKPAGTARDHLKKGSLVLLEGALRTRKWQDPSSGQDRFTTEIHASTLRMLGGKPETSSERPATSAATSSVAKEMTPIYQEPPYDGLMDDDYPF